MAENAAAPATGNQVGITHPSLPTVTCLSLFASDIVLNLPSWCSVAEIVAGFVKLHAKQSSPRDDTTLLRFKQNSASNLQ
jgi:hypothetical protein